MNDLDKLINYISKLPGVGKRSAKRIALHLLKNKEGLMLPLSGSLKDTAESIKSCGECGNYDVSDPCNICTNAKRDKTTICIVENVSDLWAMDRGGIYNGLYHILGGVLSAIDGIGPDQLNIPKMIKRIKDNNIQEVIIATNATLEGQTTAHYISQNLQPLGIKVTRLGHGIPLGGELDYMDEGTISTALKSRKAL
jgi:recombination protein RecR